VRLKKNDGLKVSGAGYGAIGPINWLAFNTQADGPTADKAVRQAIAYGSDGTRFKLTVDYGWPTVKPPAEYMKPALKKIGIDVTVRASADFPTWSKRISNHEFDMTIDNVFNWGDPVIGVHRTYNSQNIKKGVIWC